MRAHVALNGMSLLYDLFGRSNMECSGEKISGDRCLFLLLLNEDGSDEAKRLRGKDRLLKTWEFRGTEGGAWVRFVCHNYHTKADKVRIRGSCRLYTRQQLIVLQDF